MLPNEGAALARARIQTGVGEHLVDAPKARDVSQFRADRGGALRANARDVLPLLALGVVLEQVGARGFSLRDVNGQLLELLSQRTGYQAARGHGPRTRARTLRQFLQFLQRLRRLVAPACVAQPFQRPRQLLQRCVSQLSQRLG